MVRKLMKYEMIAFFRSLLPAQIVVLSLALLTRVLFFFETETTVFTILSTSSIVALVVAGVVLCVMTAVISISHFYRNLFSGEGYLSFTLPATAEQHVRAKLLSALLATLCTFVTLMLAVAIATAGDVFLELCRAGGYLCKLAWREVGWNFAGYALEALGILFFAACSLYLLFYACLALGQRARRARFLAAVGIFMGYYFVRQLLGTILLIFLALSTEQPPLLDELSRFAATSPRLFVHLLLIGGMVWNAVLGGIYYLITVQTLRKHLNLE